MRSVQLEVDEATQHNGINEKLSANLIKHSLEIIYFRIRNPRRKFLSPGVIVILFVYVLEYFGDINPSSGLFNKFSQTRFANQRKIPRRKATYASDCQINNM